MNLEYETLKSSNLDHIKCLCVKEYPKPTVNIINCVFLRHCEQEDTPNNKSVLMQLRDDAETIVNSSGVSALENKYG